MYKGGVTTDWIVDDDCWIGDNDDDKNGNDDDFT